jgi:hypothetical protein
MRVLTLLLAALVAFGAGLANGPAAAKQRDGIVLVDNGGRGHWRGPPGAYYGPPGHWRRPPPRYYAPPPRYYPPPVVYAPAPRYYYPPPRYRYPPPPPPGVGFYFGF